MMTLSICIPTYNRAQHLRNCLQSIVDNEDCLNPSVQVCVSNNASTDDTNVVVEEFRELLNIKYNVNSSNLGMMGNFLKVIEMADGEFTWMIGDDDLLMPNAIKVLLNLINKNPTVYFFFVNSFHLNADYVKNFPAPFRTKDLPLDMKKFSSINVEGATHFLDLVDPKVTFDFLGGIYLSVFKRKEWLANVHRIEKIATEDKRTFSHFDNTFPHIKIFAYAFKEKNAAYLYPHALSVCLTGVREWGALYPLVKSIRLIEALEVYKKCGLPLVRYMYCKNFALDSFGLDLLKMLLDRKNSGFAYVSLPKIILKNIFYPNFLLSFISPFLKSSNWCRVLQKLK